MQPTTATTLAVTGPAAENVTQPAEAESGFPFSNPVIKRYMMAQLGNISNEEKLNYQKRLLNLMAGREVFPVPPEPQLGDLLAQIKGN